MTKLPKKIGPVPTPVLLGGVGLFVAYHLYSARKAKDAAAAQGAAYNGGAGYTGGYGGVSGLTPIYSGGYAVGANMAHAPSGLDPATEQTLIAAQTGLTSYTLQLEQAAFQNVFSVATMDPKKRSKLNLKQLQKGLIPVPPPPPSPFSSPQVPS